MTPGFELLFDANPRPMFVFDRETLAMSALARGDGLESDAHDIHVHLPDLIHPCAGDHQLVDPILAGYVGAVELFDALTYACCRHAPPPFANT